MKLVLLPGMDGTGLLFSPLLAELHDVDTEVIPLSQEGPQDYDTLSRWVCDRLPKEEFILLAESFSGAIAAKISLRDRPALKGVIFVASFLSSPASLAVSTAKLLPIQVLSKFPGASIIHRLLFLGQSASQETVELFCRVIDTVPQSTLKARLDSISSLRYTDYKSRLPAVYVQAKGDRLVRAHKVQEFTKAYPGLGIVKVGGPHFVIQANPKECVTAIRHAICLLTAKGR